MKLLILGKKLSLYKIESKDLKILGLLDLLVTEKNFKIGGRLVNHYKKIIG